MADTGAFSLSYAEEVLRESELLIEYYFGDTDIWQGFANRYDKLYQVIELTVDRKIICNNSDNWFTISVNYQAQYQTLSFSNSLYSRLCCVLCFSFKWNLVSLALRQVASKSKLSVYLSICLSINIQELLEGNYFIIFVSNQQVNP